MMGYGSGLSGFVMMAAGVVLVVGLVALVAWAISRNSTTAATGAGISDPQRPEAMEILRARFAGGEITEVEYSEAANVLKADR